MAARGRPDVNFVEITGEVNAENHVISCQENPVCEGSTYEEEWGPVIRMRVLLPYFDHRLPQRHGTVRPMEETRVERFHEIRGAAIVHIPQCEKEALRPRGKKAPYQTDEFVSGCNYV